MGRRWYDADTLDRLNAASPERLRPMLAFMGWVGLRRSEAWNVTPADVSLTLGAATVRVIRKGGHHETLPIPNAVANAVRPYVWGREPTVRLYPRSYSTLGTDVTALGRKVGVPLASHDLRRSFGRILYYEYHVDINDIRALYGHRTIGMTEYYIGVSEDRLRTSVSAFDRPRMPHPPPVTVGV
jgi:integrase